MRNNELTPLEDMISMNPTEYAGQLIAAEKKITELTTALSAANEKLREEKDKCLQLHYETSECCKSIGHLTEKLRQRDENREMLDWLEAHKKRIYSRCPSCGNNTLTINKNRLLCTWIDCKDPTRIDHLSTVEIVQELSTLRTQLQDTQHKLDRLVKLACKPVYKVEGEVQCSCEAHKIYYE